MSLWLLDTDHVSLLLERLNDKELVRSHQFLTIFILVVGLTKFLNQQH
jgi:hypothetical protein